MSTPEAVPPRPPDQVPPEQPVIARPAELRQPQPRLPAAAGNNRNTVFSIIGIFNSVHLVQEIIEPILRLILDLLTVVLLGITFCVQSVSVIISFDSVVSGIFKSVSRTIAGVMALITNTFLQSESERKIFSQAFVNFIANIFWTYIAYTINREVYEHFFFLPMIATGVLTVLCQVYMIRNEIQIIPSRSNQRILFGLLLALSVVVFWTSLRVTGTSLSVMLLLMKVPIDTVSFGLQLLLKLSPSSPTDGVGGSGEDSLIYVSEIMRASLWALISAYEYSLCFHPYSSLPTSSSASSSSLVSQGLSALNESTVTNLTSSIVTLINETFVNMTGQPAMVSGSTFLPFLTNTLANSTMFAAAAAVPVMSSHPFPHYHSRKDRWFYLLLLFHDAIHLTMPIKKLLMKIVKDAYISQQFPRLTNDDLQSLPRDDRCSICLNEHNTTSVRLPCSHILHQSCLNRILQDARTSKCPICRAEILPNNRNNGGSGGTTSSEFILGAAPVVTRTTGNQHETAYELRDVIRVRIITPTMRLNNLATNPTANLARTNINNNNTLRSRFSFNFNNANTMNAVNPTTTAAQQPAFLQTQPRGPPEDRVMFRSNSQGSGLQYVHLNLNNRQNLGNNAGPVSSSNLDLQTLEQLFETINSQRQQRMQDLQRADSTAASTAAPLNSNDNSGVTQTLLQTASVGSVPAPTQHTSTEELLSNTLPMEQDEVISDEKEEKREDVQSGTPQQFLSDPIVATTEEARPKRGRKRSLIIEEEDTTSSTPSTRKGKVVETSAPKRRKSSAVKEEEKEKSNDSETPLTPASESTGLRQRGRKRKIENSKSREEPESKA